jgi:hypothetical protein
MLYVNLDLKAMSFSNLLVSHILILESSDAVTKKVLSFDTAISLTDKRCSWRCATRIPRGFHPVSRFIADLEKDGNPPVSEFGMLSPCKDELLFIESLMLKSRRLLLK